MTFFSMLSRRLNARYFGFKRNWRHAASHAHSFTIRATTPKKNRYATLCNTLLCTLLIGFSMNVMAKPIKFVIYGDSISAGYGMTLPESWPSLVNETFKSENKNLVVINESISGETSGGGLARLENVIKRNELTSKDWLLIELGGNDGLRGFPINTSKINLSKMVELAQSYSLNVAIMQIRIPPNYGRRYTSMFEIMYSDIAEKYDIPLVPFFMDEIAVNPNYMQNDGIHPNKSAQIIIRDIMKPEIEKLTAK